MQYGRVKTVKKSAHWWKHKGALEASIGENRANDEIQRKKRAAVNMHDSVQEAFAAAKKKRKVRTK